MLHAHSAHRAPDPFAAADRLLSALRATHPSRFSRLGIRVLNGSVALTGSVPSYYAKSVANEGVRSVFGDSPIIDALEVQERRRMLRDS